jgi:phenylacetate-CoA ligase
MTRSDWLGFWQRPLAAPEKIRRFQAERVRQLVRHAYARIPFWRRRLIYAGIKPGDIQTLEDFARIPVLRRADLVGAPLEDLTDPGIPQADRRVIRSSGTTGEPTYVVRSGAEQHKLFAYRLRAQILSGLRPWHTRLKVGSPPEILLVHKLGLFRCSNIVPGLLPGQTVEHMERVRADVLYFAPAVAEILLTSIDPERLRALRPQLIFTGSELLRPATRKRLREVFARPVIDFYGSNELNLMAWECRRCGLYHLCDDSVYFEILRPDGKPAGPGEDGRLLATGLHSFAFPLIRYELGDEVRRPASEPDCRIRFGTIDRILGRIADYISLPDGRCVTSHQIEMMTGEVPGILRFQCVQTAPEQMVWKIQPGPDFNTDSIRALERSFEPYAPTFRVRVETVEGFELTPSGKHRIVQALPKPESS